MTIATKLVAETADDARRSIEGSLERLGLDYIDVIQYHGDWYTDEMVDRILATGGALAGLQSARNEGLVRFLGFTSEGATVRSGRGVARLTLLALRFGQDAKQWIAIFESEDDLRHLPSSELELLHLAELLVEYLMSVNPALTPDELSEAMKTMGTEAQALPRTYLSRKVEQSREEGRFEAAREGSRSGPKGSRQGHVPR